MRPFYLFISLICILALLACGSEDELTPPVFSNIAGSGSLGSTEVLTKPSQDLDMTLSGNIDDFASIIIANSTVTGEKTVPVNGSDGSWNFTFTPAEGANTVSFTASDQRGNINLLYLTVTHDTTAPVVVPNGVTQGTDLLNPQLIVTFNEALLESSVTADHFVVDDTPVTGAILDTVLTNRIVTLPLSVALSAGEHRLTCPGVTDLATPDGNSVTAEYSFTFPIVPIVE